MSVEMPFWLTTSAVCSVLSFLTRRLHRPLQHNLPRPLRFNSRNNPNSFHLSSSNSSSNHSPSNSHKGRSMHSYSSLNSNNNNSNALPSLSAVAGSYPICLTFLVKWRRKKQTKHAIPSPLSFLKNLDLYKIYILPPPIYPPFPHTQ